MNAYEQFKTAVVGVAWWLSCSTCCVISRHTSNFKKEPCIPF